ncbi:MAG: SCO1664 family protein [Chloroflexota bacterium]
MTIHDDPNRTPPPEASDSDESQSIALTIDRVLEILETGTIDAEHGSIRWSSNYTFLTSVVKDDVSLMAVYKPQRGERPLWDFPDGTLCMRERAAFITSQALGWEVVPPTALREGPRGLGSVQFFIDHDPNYNYFAFDKALLPQLMRLAVFDVIINNADRKGGHCIVDSEDHLWGIDHGITFHSAHKLRTVIWNFAEQPIPDTYLDDLETLLIHLDDPQDPYTCELGRLLSPGEISAFKRRIRKLLDTRRYPIPGPGPNYPWPPV